MLTYTKLQESAFAIKFCREFLSEIPGKRGILGRNIYAKNIAELVNIDFFVDDFTDESEYLGKPIIKTEEIPEDALIVSTLLGKPLTGERHLREAGVRNLDYFAFYANSDLELPSLRFWGGFQNEYAANAEKFHWIESLLADDVSRVIYKKIINFRLSGNLQHMKGFSDLQEFQYFEDFLELNKAGEVFADVGGFDGYTSLEFIKRCPEYQAIYFFEPNFNNMTVAKERLGNLDNIHLIQKGLSNQKETLRFSSEGSVFAENVDGRVEVKVDVLDDLVSGKVTFIKMDIEGAEGAALEGCKNTILRNHPKLAICVYHKNSDFWKIPQQIMSVRHDYDIYLRHYTEGVVETVMFFVPK